MEREVKLSGVKKIRLQDLRHSHASLLISELGMPPLLVAERLEHEKIQTTLDTYSHLYPNQARDEINIKRDCRTIIGWKDDSFKGGIFRDGERVSGFNNNCS